MEEGCHGRSRVAAKWTKNAIGVWRQFDGLKKSVECIDAKVEGGRNIKGNAGLMGGQYGEHRFKQGLGR